LNKIIESYSSTKKLIDHKAKKFIAIQMNENELINTDY
jgi:hypothetical protein